MEKYLERFRTVVANHPIVSVIVAAVAGAIVG